MAGRSDISAGKAFVTLYLKNQLTTQLSRGLLLAKQQLINMSSAVKFLGASLSRVGGIGIQFGGAITAPLLAAVSRLHEAQAIFKNMGKALAEGLGRPLLPILELTRKIVYQFSAWAAVNPVLIRQVFLLGVGLAALGVAMKAVASASSIVAIGLTTAAAGLGSLAAIVGFLGSPLGLVVAAIAGGVVAWMKFTESGKAAAGFISAKFAELLSFVTSTIGGIRDAIIAGNLGLAARIAMAAVMVPFEAAKGAILVSWAQLMLGLVSSWESFKLSIIGGWDEVAIKFTGITAYFSSLWTSLVEFLRGFWLAFIDVLNTSFPGTMQALAAGWNFLKEAGKAALTFITDYVHFLWEELKAIWDMLKRLVIGFRDVAVAAAKASGTAVLETLEGFTGLEADFTGTFKDTKAARDATFADAARAQQEAEEKERARRAGPAAEREAEAKKKVDGRSDAVEKAKADRDKAVADAEAARQKLIKEAGAAADAAGKKPGLLLTPDISTIATIATSTGGALALGFGGGGGGVAQQTLAEIRAAKKLAHDDQKLVLAELQRKKGAKAG